MCDHSYIVDQDQDTWRSKKKIVAFFIFPVLKSFGTVRGTNPVPDLSIGQAKIVKKTLNPTVLYILYDFLSFWKYQDPEPDPESDPEPNPDPLVRGTIRGSGTVPKCHESARQQHWFILNNRTQYQPFQRTVVHGKHHVPYAWRGSDKVRYGTLLNETDPVHVKFPMHKLFLLLISTQNEWTW